MKFVTFILSFYILTLNFLPCEDGDLLQNEMQVEIVHSVDDNHGHIDMCSPFCQCQCCHIQTTFFKIAELSLGANDIATTVFLHFESLGKDISKSILQPPRV
tara:strand:- start:529 stop:834 length:306 start_codon:yes stop_codon:yes gene_type:complete